MVPKHRRGAHTGKRPVPHPVDQVFESTIRKHADTARTRKEQRERERLCARRRVTYALFDAVMKELHSRPRNGARPDDVKIAEACEEAAKDVLKKLGIEHGPVKDD